MRRRRAARIYTRSQGGQERYYGDFRSYGDVGGRREALIPDGASRATTDAAVAAKLFAERLEALEARRRNRNLHGIEKQASLASYAAYHLRQKAKDGQVTYYWLEQEERHLRDAIRFFGPEVDLAVPSPETCTRWVDHLRSRPNGRGGTLSDSSIRKRLNSLSNLFRRAISEGYVSRNPVADMYSKPTESRREARYLEAPEAALLLESARTYEARVADGAFPWMYPLLATFLLTGGRKSEVLGLEVDDVSLRHRKIYFRPNKWRRLKTRGSKRRVPLWPQLEDILREYLVTRERGGGLGRLLFPRAGDEEKMVTDVRRALDRIATRAGFGEGDIRLHLLRHTYTAARLQTCDRGRPVALYTVARELGHSSTAMIEDRYGHVHDRTEEGASEVVEYRVEQWRATLGERLALLER